MRAAPCVPTRMDRWPRDGSRAARSSARGMDSTSISAPDDARSPRACPFPSIQRASPTAPSKWICRESAPTPYCLASLTCDGRRLAGHGPSPRTTVGERAVPHVRKFLGQRLRELRKQRGLSQERLGERSSLSGKFIGEVERGEKSISIDSLYRVSVALEVPLRQLTDVRPGRRAVVPSEDA